MAETHTQSWKSNGYISPVSILTLDSAAQVRSLLETTEAAHGALHYVDKVHTTFPWVWDLCVLPTVLAVVTDILGDDIMLYNSTFIVKEAGTASHVSWHQDLTYWGLEDDDGQASMWLALSPATAQSGCMTMLPGSHLGGRLEHQPTSDEANVLLLGQTITGPVDITKGVLCPLLPGQASFHHGWTCHQSGPNTSSDRRIGLNVQYLSSSNRHVSGRALSAALVSGVDAHGNFAADRRPSADPDATAMKKLRERDRAMKQGFKIAD